MSPQPHRVPSDESHIQNSFTPVQNTSHKITYLAYSQLQRQKKKKKKKRNPPICQFATTRFGKYLVS